MLAIIIVLVFLSFVFWFEIYVSKKPGSEESVEYIVLKGRGDEEISKDLKERGIIKSEYFFRGYVFFTFQDKKLQAGKYILSPAMSVRQIVEKFVSGDVVKNRITIIEGWNVKDIAEYFEGKNISKKEDFIKLAGKDFSEDFSFLSELPEKTSLEGYLFPDTYEILEGESAENIVKIILANFGKKITTELKEAAASEKKSIFEIITMASIIEKEVKTIDDKKIVSGILWKRLEAGMPLQVDATINYITGKNRSSALFKDIEIDSLYNTYKYRGLPLGPISNPGMDSILAAIYPTESKYWYYLSAKSGETVFSETLKKHNIARSLYLK
ncbi:MAG: endolytic transglycosylase MltG [Candidatus Staskawiczbacteria bacterium]|nr:endolytic transglycosylase MltG [Candidatus Staskawiczbacteria bacterium]